MTPETRALIEAAEEAATLICISPCYKHEHGLLYKRLLAAISSAKAAEEGVETHNLIESAKRVIREKANCGDDCTVENCAYFDLWASTVAAEEK